MGRYSDKEIDSIIDRTVGFYYEKTKHDFELVMEATDFITERLKDMVTRDEFNDLKDEVKLIRLAVTGTNKDLRQLDKRVGGLDTRVGKLDGRVGKLDKRVSLLARDG